VSQEPSVIVTSDADSDIRVVIGSDQEQVRRQGLSEAVSDSELSPGCRDRPPDLRGALSRPAFPTGQAQGHPLYSSERDEDHRNAVDHEKERGFSEKQLKLGGQCEEPTEVAHREPR
jgi:hypothetical protein